MKSIFLKLFLLFVTVLMASCGSTGGKKPTSIEGIYKYTTELSCKYRNSGNKKYCGCFAEVMSEVTPNEVKVMASDPARSNQVSQEIAKIMISNTKKLSACDKYKSAKSDIPAVGITSLADQTLRNNKGRLLTPDLLGDLQIPDMKIGYEFSMHYTGAELSSASKYRLSKIDQGKYYFDYVYPDGKVLRDKYYWHNGANYIQIQKNGKLQYRLRDGMEKCKFVLGSCSYTTSSGRVQHVYTEYRKGIWYNSYKRFRKQIVDLNIYDVNGYPLYRYHYVVGNTKHLEQVKVDKF